MSFELFCIYFSVKICSDLLSELILMIVPWAQPSWYTWFWLLTILKMISAMRLATVKAPLLARVIHKIDHSEKPEISIYQIWIKTKLGILFSTSSRQNWRGHQGSQLSWWWRKRWVMSHQQWVMTYEWYISTLSRNVGKLTRHGFKLENEANHKNGLGYQKACDPQHQSPSRQKN